MEPIPLEPILLEPLGEITLVPPTSYAAVYDIMTVWGTIETQARAGINVDGVKMGRLLWAGIGLCWPGRGGGEPCPPRYKVETADPVSYGAEVMEWLVIKRVHLAGPYPRIQQILAGIFDFVPSAVAVEEHKDFSDAGARLIATS